MSGTSGSVLRHRRWRNRSLNAQHACDYPHLFAYNPLAWLTRTTKHAYCRVDCQLCGWFRWSRWDAESERRRVA